MSDDFIWLIQLYVEEFHKTGHYFSIFFTFVVEIKIDWEKGTWVLDLTMASN